MTDCECPKCGEKGRQQLYQNKKTNRAYLKITHKDHVCHLGRARTADEVFKEMGFW